MEKKSTPANERDIERAAIIKKTARINGVSDRYVRMVMENERENENVVFVFMTLKEGIQKLEDNLLLKAVKELVPLN